MFAYVGSRTTRERNARGEGISVYHVDEEKGELELVQVVGDLVNPSYLLMNYRGDRLYSVHGDRCEVSAFVVDPKSGYLTLLNQQSTEGHNPVHLALDPSEQYLIVSNHIGASLAVLSIAADGSLQPLSQLLALEGPVGPHRIEQPHAKPHFNLFDPRGRFVLVPDKGLDRIFSFAFLDGRLLPAASPFVTTREGAGPRHLAFHPHLAKAYVVNELDSTVTSYDYEEARGALQPRQILSTLPANYTGNSRAAGISVDGQGRFLYASNRGFDSIAVYAIDDQSGLLQFVTAVPSGGTTPRFFTIAPNGRHLFALNEDSDSIVTFVVDAEYGVLEQTGSRIRCGSPVCMIFSA
ncbi:lactonase family protein [Pseudomonas oryzihabitans]|uniref:Hemagglutinin n=1 Tax=Pseudomonas oryzihabitans TaxID=47885 RepID=A0ABX3IK12_9PSED|nr:lactonase family protein [Pseudomonas psychrotolerans]ONN68660.1 hemagglutinin [Pseudomonas psychrotolerans]